MNFDFINNFSFSGANDWILLLIFLGVAFVYGLTMGRGRLLVVILATYFAYFLVKAFPWKELSFLGLKQEPGSAVQIFIFLAVILGFYFLIPYSSLRVLVSSRGRGVRGKLWQLLIFSILQIGLILEMVINFLPPKVIVALSPLAKLIFIGPWPYFIWILLPFLAIIFLRQSRHYDVGG
ncbi:MAG: hypothetical protein UV36_C0009G0009 [Parcubacteria group bacterium GW2011_GWC2_42_6]|nr:MAG: hypothetical protein UV36_C0009G0009 [Parcubacteria group bacterium GW2011_GWC2_42_6]KKT76706.1 MAG: hypothetical protein UW72_C0002G0008 [Parcubacteria group bacterium GW2011_GWF2_44_7]